MKRVLAVSAKCHRDGGGTQAVRAPERTVTLWGTCEGFRKGSRHQSWDILARGPEGHAGWPSARLVLQLTEFRASLLSRMLSFQHNKKQGTFSRVCTERKSRLQPGDSLCRDSTGGSTRSSARHQPQPQPAACRPESSHPPERYGPISLLLGLRPEVAVTFPEDSFSSINLDIEKPRGLVTNSHLGIRALEVKRDLFSVIPQCTHWTGGLIRGI